MQVTVKHPSGPKKFVLTPSRQALGKTLGRRDRQSFVKHAVQDLQIRAHIVMSMKKVCKNEIKRLCSKSSLLQSRKEDLCSFDWSRVCEELKQKAPCLSSLLYSCIPPSNRQAIAGTCVAILVKARRKSACLLQKVASLILYAGHAGTQVSNLFCDAERVCQILQ